MQTGIKGRKVAFLATDGVEQVELTEPWNALKNAGANVQLISIASGEIQGVNGMEKGDRFPVDCTLDSAKATDYAALVLPGGVANPDKLRMDPRAVAFVKDFMESDKPVAAICHGPWLLVEANVVRGRTLTSWPSVKTDILNAGGDWVDKAVQVDQSLITSRKPDDLPHFCAKIVSMFETAVDETKIDQMVQQTFPASDPLPGPSVAGGKPSSARARADLRTPGDGGDARA